MALRTLRGWNGGDLCLALWKSENLYDVPFIFMLNVSVSAEKNNTIDKHVIMQKILNWGEATRKWKRYAVAMVFLSLVFFCFYSINVFIEREAHIKRHSNHGATAVILATEISVSPIFTGRILDIVPQQEMISCPLDLVDSTVFLDRTCHVIQHSQNKNGNCSFWSWILNCTELLIPVAYWRDDKIRERIIFSVENLCLHVWGAGVIDKTTYPLLSSSLEGVRDIIGCGGLEDYPNIDIYLTVVLEDWDAVFGVVPTVVETYLLQSGSKDIVKVN